LGDACGRCLWEMLVGDACGRCLERRVPRALNPMTRRARAVERAGKSVPRMRRTGWLQRACKPKDGASAGDSVIVDDGRRTHQEVGYEACRRPRPVIWVRSCLYLAFPCTLPHRSAAAASLGVVRAAAQFGRPQFGGPPTITTKCPMPNAIPTDPTMRSAVESVPTADGSPSENDFRG